ncbi:hypothetical protein RI129_001896 [Pyrocoelia pectoralis]|uniref:ferroxidase n=1 Tax=Pyrocoelia pectoralis TaxID=417401 RepID=A0AAN7ZUD2_9COLE
MQCPKRLVHLKKCLNVHRVRNTMTQCNLLSVTPRKLSYIPIATKLFDQFPRNFVITYQCFCTKPNETIDSITYEKICEDTLESLTEYIEELIESAQNLKLADVAYSDGVLTVNFGNTHGTYVINRQTPNRQIWLSSPTSGPKRYDFDTNNNCWIYKHDGRTLHQLLQEEFSKIIRNNVDFSKCSYSLV